MQFVLFTDCLIMFARDRDTTNVTWSAFHENLCQSTCINAELSLLDISSMLPLFQEETKSTAMVSSLNDNYSGMCVLS